MWNHQPSALDSKLSRLFIANFYHFLSFISLFILFTLSLICMVAILDLCKLDQVPPNFVNFFPLKVELFGGHGGKIIYVIICLRSNTILTGLI